MGVGNRDVMVWREGHLPSDLKSTPGMSSSILLAYRASARLFKRKARFVFLTRFSPTLLDSFPETAQAPKKRCLLVGMGHAVSNKLSGKLFRVLHVPISAF